MLTEKGIPKQNVISFFHVVHLSHNNSIDPVITNTLVFTMGKYWQ